jgi:CheY-like chemotaxis protein
MGKRVLVVDDDPWIIRMVSTVMEQKGHQVDTASDGRQGLEKALTFCPDVIIADVLMPVMDGWSFIRELRSHKEMSLVPVIFLTGLNSDEDRILGFRLGADDYLPKPFRLEELALRVEKALRASDSIVRHISEIGGAPGGDSDGVGFKGDLAHLGVSSILTILEMERKSGILVLRGASTARIFLRLGKIHDARFDGAAQPRGADVIYELLRWKSGSFEFSALEVEMDDSVDTPVSHLLIEGARRLDEEAAPPGRGPTFRR